MGQISFTKLETLDTCGRKFYLKYTRRVPGAVQQQNFVAGRVTHDAIKDWAHGGWNDALLVPAVKQHMRDELAVLRVVPQARAAELIRTAATATLNAARIYRSLQFPEHGAIIEERFMVPIPHLRDHLNGAVDVYDPVAKAVYDLKTYTGNYSGKRDQLYTYALAEMLLGREVESGGFIYPLRKASVETIPIVREHLEAIARRYGVALTAIRGGHFTYRVGKHCLFCDYYKSKYCKPSQGTLPDEPVEFDQRPDPETQEAPVRADG